MRVQPQRKAAVGVFQRRRILGLGADQRQAGQHARRDLLGRRLERARPLAVIQLHEHAQRRGVPVRLLAPALLEHALVQPLVPVILEDQGQGLRGPFFRLGWRIRIGRFQRGEDQRRILRRRVMRREEQRHCRRRRALAELRLVGHRAAHPVERDALVQERGSHLQRVGRSLGAEQAVGGHRITRGCCGLSRQFTPGCQAPFARRQFPR